MKIIEPLEFFKYALVGGSGVIVNMAVLYILMEFLGFKAYELIIQMVTIPGYMIAAFFAISCAVMNNYLGSRFWVFRSYRRHPA